MFRRLCGWVTVVTMCFAVQRDGLALLHDHEGLQDGGPGHAGQPGPALHHHVHPGLRAALAVAHRAHVGAAVLRPGGQYLHTGTF